MKNIPARIGAIQITGRPSYAEMAKSRKVIVNSGSPMEPDWLRELEAAGYEVIDGTDIRVQYDYILPQTPKDNPITVKGNSLQEVVQGKRHSWPAPKKRKGLK